MLSASYAWQCQVKHVLRSGLTVNNTKELIASQIGFDMRYPVVYWPGRKANYRFMAAEAAYIISGKNDVEYLADVLTEFSRYSDDGYYQAGSYGPPFVDQMPYILQNLKESRTSRQAVISIWRPRPYPSKDIPCTLTLQFLIRQGVLDCVVNMRSSDVFTGLLYDMFCFSCMASVVAYFTGSELGTCYVHAGSSHLYDRDFDAAMAISESDFSPQSDDKPKLHVVSPSELVSLLETIKWGDETPFKMMVAHL